jgi:hypothetical protein
MIRSKELDYIQIFVETETGLKLDKDTHKREYVYARAIYFEIARKKTNLTLAKIGSHVGRDHASVIHGKKAFEQIKNYEPEFYDVYKKILREYNFKKQTLNKDYLLLKRRVYTQKRINLFYFNNNI